MEVIGADGVGETDLIEVEPQLHGRPGEVEFDVPHAQTADHLTQGYLGARVDVADERGVENHVSHGLRRAIYGCPKPAFEKWALAKNILSWIR